MPWKSPTNCPNCFRSFHTYHRLQTNRAIIYSRTGPPPEVISVLSYPPLSPPSPGTLNLRFVLSPVNPSDINVIEGVYPLKPPPSHFSLITPPTFIAGNEGLAEVRGVGEGVYGFSDGDWVVLTKQQGGTWNTAVNVDASGVVKLREGGLVPAWYSSQRR